MTWLIAALARWGVPEGIRKPLAWLSAALAVLALLWLVRAFYDRSVIERHAAEVEAKASDLRERAADERVNDAATNAASEKGLNDAINKAPATGTVSPAAHALACERLRRIGREPASCRSGGSDGTQAAAN